MLTDLQKLMLDVKVCPYCSHPSKLVDSQVVYGRSYGLIYLCKPCDALVGVHTGTTVAKGRLANSCLRISKIEAHKYFDQIWKLKIMSRSNTYSWLSNQLNIPPQYTHIGMFNTTTCKRVVDVCKKLLKNHGINLAG